MKQPSSIIPLLIGAASVVIVVAGLKQMAALLSPILLSLFIVLVSNPIMIWLHRRGLPAWLAYLLVVLGVITVGFIFILFFAVSVSQLTNALPTYQDLIEARIAGFEQWLAQYDYQIEDIFKLNWFDPENILKTMLSFVGALLGTVSDVGLTLLIFIYMLASAAGFSARLRQGLADNNPLLRRFSDFAHSTSTYLLIKSWLGSITALLQVVLMFILGIDFAILWGVLSFLFNFVPNIGFYIAMIPPIIISLIKFGLGKTLVLIVGYTVINNLFDILVAPRYLGEGLDLSTLVTFLAVVFWAWVLGPIGAFMALPLTVMVKKLVLESFSDTQLLAKLMSAGTK
jgi:predicted PurR-regulated permease PerM